MDYMIQLLHIIRMMEMILQKDMVQHIVVKFFMLQKKSYKDKHMLLLIKIREL